MEEKACADAEYVPSPASKANITTFNLIILLKLEINSVVVLPQGYERVRRVSEDDNSTAPSYEDDEEEGLDEVPSREALPKEVRGHQVIYTVNMLCTCMNEV